MSNFTRNLEKLIKPILLIAAFILVFLFGFYREAHAETQVEVGAGLLSGQYSKGPTILATERWGGPLGSRYAVGMGYIYKQEVTDRRGYFYKLSENLFVFVQRRVCFVDGDHLCLGMGPAYFNATNRALGSNFTIALSLEYRHKDHLSVNFRHFSNGGSAVPNMGQDMLTLGWRF